MLCLFIYLLIYYVWALVRSSTAGWLEGDTGATEKAPARHGREQGDIKLLDFVDFAVQAANSRIGPFVGRVFNLTQ